MQLAATLAILHVLSASSGKALSEDCVCGTDPSVGPDCVNITKAYGKQRIALLTQITDNIATYAHEAMAICPV